jgi:selenide,water dikinase
VNHFDDIDAFSLDLLTDPQTSGGLLITCSPSIEMEVLSTLKDDGFAEAKRIGHITSDGNQIKVIK